MNSWNLRKYFVLGFLVFLIFLGSIILLFSIFYKKPTCFDGVKNQNENGVDCGGKCLKICEDNVLPLNVGWARAFKIKDGRYSVLAFSENRNKFEGRAKYLFSVYDEQNILIRNLEGESIIPAFRPFAVFSGNIDVGSRTPGRVIFEFTDISWYKNEKGSDNINVGEVRREQDSYGAPRISAILKNVGNSKASSVVSVSILYDSLGNAIGGLKVPVGDIKVGESKNVYFAWPFPLQSNIDKVDILKWVEDK